MNKHADILLILSAMVVLASCAQREEPVEPRSFDRATWDTTEYSKTMANPKHRMALSLVQKETLIGKSEGDVRQMLGEPMYTIDDWPTNGARQLQYGVGPSTSLTGLSFHALFVELSAPSGVVTRATIGQRNI